MKAIKILILLLLLAPACIAQTNFNGSAKDRADLVKTSEAIHKAFFDGNADAVMKYHHPDVIKSFAYNSYIVGADSVRAGLVETFKNTHLEFLENKVESTLFNGNTAVESYLFTIKGTPKNGGEPFIFKGRSIVVYVRYKKSPTGWASIREVVQPAP
jgi:ketosteroid isomerase-like protein